MLLPAFKNTNSVLNNCFSTLLLGLKKTTSEQDHEIVRSLVNIAAGLKRAVQTHILESMDLEERLAMVERMLKECMSSDSMDDEKNVAIVLQSRENDHKLKYEHLRLSEARSFISGPLELCIKYKLYAMIGTAQVRKIWVLFTNDGNSVDGCLLSHYSITGVYVRGQRVHGLSEETQGAEGTRMERPVPDAIKLRQLAHVSSGHVFSRRNLEAPDAHTDFGSLYQRLRPQ